MGKTVKLGICIYKGETAYSVELDSSFSSEQVNNYHLLISSKFFLANLLGKLQQQTSASLEAEKALGPALMYAELVSMLFEQLCPAMGLGTVVTMNPDQKDLLTKLGFFERVENDQ